MTTSTALGSAERARVAIIGAGPGGSAAAIRLAQLGVRDVVLVDLHDFPRDKTCGSGLSPRAIATLKQLRVWDRVEPLAYPIVGTRIASPGGCETWVSGGERAAAAICLRRDFDFELYRAVLELGVRFLPHFRAKHPILRRDASGRERWAGIRAADGREIRADFVVVANGAHSTFASVPGRKRAIHTIMGWWENVDYRPHHVEMLWVDLLRPCYGWLFPETATRVNIGITYDDDDKSKNARALFERFLERHFAARLARATKIGAFKGHPIVYCYRPRKLTSPGRIAIGEAGRMTHPATGEGIYQAMHSGMLAADAIAAVAAGRCSEARAFAHYERCARRRFTPSFWAGAAFRGVVRTPLFDAVVKLGSTPQLQRATGRALASL
ncbi:MAG TPA: NAD(P)/FAD-dependent oxidoreductase [Myxococcota bacterium]|nr:NAD(P)/FAD-dependent oxidoreductase [Myxococcota bacterium]